MQPHLEGGVNDQPDATQEQMRRAVTAIARVYARGRKEWLETCYRKGAAAQGRFMRVSPYYEDPGADLFWYAGYDGLSFQDAVLLHDAAYDKGKKAREEAA